MANWDASRERESIADDFDSAVILPLDAVDVQVHEPCVKLLRLLFQMRLLGVVVPLPGHMLNGGRPRDRECDGTDNGGLTVVTRHGGVSRAGF